MKYNKGFTLIELLVVIAIIGILASVVLAALTNARVKGQQAAVQSQVSNMRAQAELYYANNTNYGTGYAAGYTGAGGTSVLPTSCTTDVGTGLFATGSGTTLGLGGLLKGACSSGATAAVASVDAATATKWAVMVTAPGTTTYYCADSTGASKAYTSTPAAFAAGAAVCP